MTQQHPITPPPELVKQWMEEFTDPENAHWKEYEVGIATRAAHWGADQELEACCEWLEQKGFAFVDEIRAARRPKPPSLKEQALQALAEADLGLTEAEWPHRSDTIRRALEQLDD